MKLKVCSGHGYNFMLDQPRKVGTEDRGARPIMHKA